MWSCLLLRLVLGVDLGTRPPPPPPHGAAFEVWRLLLGAAAGGGGDLECLCQTVWWPFDARNRWLSTGIYGHGSKPMVPSWDRCTTHFRTYFSGDWDVHWGYGVLTHI